MKEVGIRRERLELFEQKKPCPEPDANDRLLVQFSGVRTIPVSSICWRSPEK